jgi:hypothetical protein
MEPLGINKLTREVGLVLISSSLILGGCSRHEDEEKKEEQKGPAQPARGRWYSGGGHGGYVPMRSAGRSVAPGSVRGGFGATGHAAAAGS